MKKIRLDLFILISAVSLIFLWAAPIVLWNKFKVVTCLENNLEGTVLVSSLPKRYCQFLRPRNKQGHLSEDVKKKECADDLDSSTMTHRYCA